jgi:CRP-like cAMP-binding protein
MGAGQRLPLRCESCRLAVAGAAEPCPFVEHRHDAGAALLWAGEVPKAVHYVRRGLVVLASARSGEAVACAVRGPETLLGLEALEHGALAYQVTALTDVVECRLSIERFTQWLGPLEAPLGVVLRLALREASLRVAERHALEGTAVQRVARFVLRASSAGDEPLQLPQHLVARVLHMRPETFSRAVSSLRRAGALGPGHTLCVADPERLRGLVAER